jgi:tetratricopeptide (TPR) repeat protein
MKDNQGLKVTIDLPEAINAINESTEILFRKKGGIEKFLPIAADAHPNCAILQIYSAILFFLSFSAKVICEKIPFYLNRINVDQINSREKLHYFSLKLLEANDFYGAIENYQHILDVYPKDKVAIYMLETTAFLAGEMSPLSDSYEKIYPLYKNDPDFLSMLSFLYAHINRYSEASALSKSALKLTPHNAWAQHVYIHSLSENNDPAALKDAVSFLEQNTEDWAAQNRFFEGHNWMHLCVLYLHNRSLVTLDQVSISEAIIRYAYFFQTRAQSSHSDLLTEDGRVLNVIIDAYDKHIWGAAKEFNFEQNNAFLTLWNIELSGYKKEVIVDLWADLAKYAEPFMDDYFTPYLTVTAILTVAKADLANAEKATMCYESFAISLPINSTQRVAWHSVGLQVLKGCMAYIKGEYEKAVTLLENIHENTRPMGHSDEQRSIFTRTYQLAKKLASENILASDSSYSIST